MAFLFVAALLWLGLNVGVSGTRLRGVAVGVIGERAFRAAFSAGSVILLILLALAYARADTTPLWLAPPWLVGLLDVVMLGASVLLVASLTPSNPTMAGTEQALGQAPRGIFRITRHPMLCAIALWAIVHLLANGDTASLVFFATLLLTVLVGMPSIDAKLARRDPQAWAALARATSIVPFAAILGGRNQVYLSEIGWRTPLIGVLLWVLLIGVHRWLFGASPLPA